MVACGLGMAIVNPLTALHFRGRGLHVRAFVPVIGFRVSVIRPTDRPKLEACDTLIELLRNSCARCLADLAASPVPPSSVSGFPAGA
jgi:DNA-binding transcriptional LysR family regulator